MNLNGDYRYIQFIQKKENLSDESMIMYRKTLIDFCRFVGMDFCDMVDEILDEQHDYIKDNVIIKYDEDSGKLAKWIYSYRVHLKDRGNKNTTINLKVRNLKTIFNAFKIKFPNVSEFENDCNEWYRLDKKDIQDILFNTRFNSYALIVFMCCTGRRQRDIINLTVNDFMVATSKYHECTEVDDFLECAPKDMIGLWKFYPNKTRKHKVLCVHGNTPESSNLLLKLLKERNDKYNENRKSLKKSDSLFISSKTGKKYSKFGLTSLFKHQNNTFRKNRVLSYRTRLEEGEISMETYEDLVESIPKFTPHSLRKYYSSIVAEHCGNLRVSALMEGHAMPLPTDSNYVRIDDERVMDEYMNLIPYFSFEPTRVKILTTEKLQRYEDELAEQKRINEEYGDKFKRLESFIKQLDKFDFDKI